MTIRIPTPEKMQKYPWQTTTVSLFSVCALLLYIIINRPACDSDDWKKAYKEERQKNDWYTKSLMVKDGMNQKLIAKIDSLSKVERNENLN